MFGLGTLGNLVVKITADTEGFKSGIDKLGGVMKGFGKAALGYLSYKVIKKIISGIVELAKTGAEVEGVTNAFEGLTASIEGGSNKMMASLKKGSLGMISQTQLMKSFNNAAQLIGKDFAQTLPDAMKYFTKISASTGESVDYLMDSYVRGIGRMSPMILDNLKVQVTQAEATARASEMYGVATDELTKYQLQMAMATLVNEKLALSTADLPELLGKSAQAFEEIKATAIDFRDALAVKLLPIFNTIAGAILTAFASEAGQAAITNFFDWLTKVIGDESSGLTGILFTLINGDFPGALEMAFGEESAQKLINFYDQLVILEEQLNNYLFTYYAWARGAQESLNVVTERFEEFDSFMREKTRLMIEAIYAMIDAWNVFKDKVITFTNNVTAKMEAFDLFMKSKATSISGAFTGIDWFGIGTKIGTGIGEGIRSMIGWVVAQAKKMAAAVNAVLSGIWGIHSPSTYMEKMGRNLVKGLMLGIEGKQFMVATAMADTLGSVSFGNTGRYPASAPPSITYINQGIDLTNEGKVQDLLDPFLREGVRKFG